MKKKGITDKEMKKKRITDKEMKENEINDKEMKKKRTATYLSHLNNLSQSLF